MSFPRTTRFFVFNYRHIQKILLCIPLLLLFTFFLQNSRLFQPSPSSPSLPPPSTTPLSATNQNGSHPKAINQSIINPKPNFPIFPNVPADYMELLQNASNTLFLLEPYLLLRTLPDDEASLREFKWRFNLPAEFTWKPNSLTVGILVENISSLNISPKFNQTLSIFGASSPFVNSSASKTPHHLFYTANSPHSPLHLHIVVFHRVHHFFWIGSIPEKIQFTLTDDSHSDGLANSRILHFGQNEQIFDIFNLTFLTSQDRRIFFPAETKHFLSQLPTSRYLHCDHGKTETWLEANNLTINEGKVAASKTAIQQFKAFMKELEMEFWIACGTLLGWYRQCTVTPFTTDTDFGSWSKYLKGRNPTVPWKALAAKHSLKMTIRFGEPTHTFEFSFDSKPANEKVDLFFLYKNGTHFLMPVHAEPEYLYEWYPIFHLCSVEFLGYKLLAPCDPKLLIETEYGTTWNEPVKTFNYMTAPKNSQPAVKYPYGGKQVEWF